MSTLGNLYNCEVRLDNANVYSRIDNVVCDRVNWMLYNECIDVKVEQM